MPPEDYVPREEFSTSQRYVERTMDDLRAIVQEGHRIRQADSERIVALEVQMGNVASSVSGLSGEVKALSSTVTAVCGKVDGVQASISGRREQDAQKSTVHLALRVALAALALAALVAGAYKVGNSSSVTVAPEVLQQALEAAEAKKNP